MIKEILHIALQLLLMPLLLVPMLTGCTDSGDDAYQPLPSRPVELELTIALTTRGGDEKEVPDCEKVQKDQLRIIMINEEAGADGTTTLGAVEYNGIPSNIQGPFEGPTNTDGIQQFKKIYKVKIQATTAGKKRFYALANAENLLTNDIKQGKDGAALIKQLEELTFSEKLKVTPSSSEGEYIPMSSPAYYGNVFIPTLEKTTSEEGDNKVTIVMAYAAVKFSFKFVNDIQATTDRQDLTIVGWTFRPLATKSYLLPHMDSDSWQKLIELGGQTFGNSEASKDEWVTDYEIPQKLNEEGDDSPNEGQTDYIYTYETPLILPYGSDKAIDEEAQGIFYYLHESKSELEEEDAQSIQAYYLTLRIRDKNTQGDKFLICGPKHLPNLQSLVRGTHVRITATIKALPDKGDNSLDVRVKTWIRDQEVEGGWEEVESQNGADEGTDNEETDNENPIQTHNE